MSSAKTKKVPATLSDNRVPLRTHGFLHFNFNPVVKHQHPLNGLVEPCIVELCPAELRQDLFNQLVLLDDPAPAAIPLGSLLPVAAVPGFVLLFARFTERPAFKRRWPSISCWFVKS